MRNGSARRARGARCLSSRTLVVGDVLAVGRALHDVGVLVAQVRWADWAVVSRALRRGEGAFG